MSGSVDFLGGNGGAFCTKTSFFGHTVWFNFYNTAISMQIINVVYIESTDNIFAQLDNGLVMLLDDSDGSIIKAKQVENQGRSPGLYQNSASVLDSSNNMVSAISAGTSLNSVDYTWHLTMFSADLETKKYDYRLGYTNYRGMNGPRSMCMMGNFVFTGGAVTVDDDDEMPHAVVMTLHEADLTFASVRDYNNKGKVIHLQCDKPEDRVYISLNNRSFEDDMHIGTGHWSQIVRLPVDPTTGFIDDQEKRGILEFAVSDVCDTFQVVGDYIFVVCSYTSPLRNTGGSPHISIWAKADFAWVDGINLNFGLTYPTDGATLTRHIIPNSNMQGNYMYFYGTTL